MKKILTMIALVFGLTLTTQSQTFYTFDMMNAQSLVLSNTICITNLLTGGAAGGTNWGGTEFTNLFGTKVVVPVTGSSAATGLNLLKDVLFPVDFAGKFGLATIAGTNTVQSPFCASINVHLVGQSGANTADTFMFQLLDGEGVPYTDRSFSFTVTPTTTTAINMATNLTVSQLFGVKGIRCKYILAGDTDASSAVVIKQLNFNCWVP